MGKTYKRNQSFRPKKHGQVFTKDQSQHPWKKQRPRDAQDTPDPRKFIPSDYQDNT